MSRRGWPVVIWIHDDAVYDDVHAVARDIKKVQMGTISRPAGEWTETCPTGKEGQALLAFVDRAEDMGRTALTEAARGMRGVVVYQNRYLTAFGEGPFHTEEIKPADFALPPFSEWGRRERFIWYGGLMRFAWGAEESLLASMDEARKWMRDISG